MTDDAWQSLMMERALTLAEKARGQNHPGPMVGAVLASKQVGILGEGCYRAAEKKHAEAKALENWEQVPADAVFFVTLEPCLHRSGSEACTDLILRKKVRHLVVGSLDANPLHQGNGLRKLEGQGVKVEISPLESKIQKLNELFFFHIRHKRPYLGLKAALSLDSKIAMADGTSRWITNEQSRARAHFLRQSFQSLAVGKNTLTLDNPSLTCRLPDASYQPIKIVFSSRAKVPSSSHFFQDRSTARFVVAGKDAADQDLTSLEQAGITVVQTPSALPLWQEALPLLYQHKVTSILLEGGKQLYTQAIAEQVVQRYYFFIAPKFLGENGLSWLGDVPAVSLDRLYGVLEMVENLEGDLYASYRAEIRQESRKAL